MTVVIHSGIVATAPTNLTDTIKISVPDAKANDRVTYGPLKFAPTVSGSGGVRLPQVGDRALVGVEQDTGEAWVVSWYRDDATSPPYIEFGSPLYVIKLADTNRPSTVSLAPDPHLQIAGTSGLYFLDSLILYNATVTADLKGMFYFGGAFVTGCNFIAIRDPISFSQYAVFGDTDEFIANGSASEDRCILVSGSFLANENFTLSFFWAQNTSEATNTKVLEKSYMRLLKVSS